MSAPLFEIKDLVFSYKVDGKEVEVLKHLNFKVEPGEFVGIQGPSGSGKSTLFYILGFLLKPTSGVVRFDGVEITQLSTDELTVTRNQKIGFVFQQFHLLSKANVLENILLPTRYPSELSFRDPKYHDKAFAMAEKLGLGMHLHHSPNQLSGGQQQRVAIARALMNDVELILADEPTGNLDSKTAGQILDLLGELNRAGKTIILITHDSEVAKSVPRFITCATEHLLRSTKTSRSPTKHPAFPLDARAHFPNFLKNTRPHFIKKLQNRYSLSWWRTFLEIKQSPFSPCWAL